MKLYHVAILLAVVFATISCCRPLMDNVDMGWHVAQGRWMALHGSVYRRDVLNYPNWGHSLVNEYPLYQIVLYELWKWGWAALFLFSTAIYGLLVFTLVRAARLFLPSGSALFSLTLGLMLVYFQLAFPLRPHLVTYLGVGILGVFLLRHRNAGSWTVFWPMALLQIAWTNCHSAFVLGPMMVGLFGFEMAVRNSLRERRIAWGTIRLWLGAFLLILAACFVNPFGVERFYPPFYQGQLEEIRAYVGEMQPLTGLASSLIVGVTLVGAAAVLAAALRGKAISYSFLLLGVLLFLESLSVLKSWPVFGLFPPLLVLSCGAFGSSRPQSPAMAWASLGGNFLVSVFLLLGITLRLTLETTLNLPLTWREYDLGRRELPYTAVEWMRAHKIEGRLLHRSEDGGLLQVSGYDQGETFSDTGFGKYDEKLIRIVSIIGERAALIPLYDAAYRPEFVVCNSLSFRWPFYLRQAGWRMIFYSVSGTVWTRPEIRPDLPTVPGEAPEAALLRDVAQHGRPGDPLLFGRNLLAMNSNGREDFAFAQLIALPGPLHHVPWYWEAARIMCFETPSFSPEHRHRLLSEAEGLHDGSLTAEFRALAHAQEGDEEGARKILEAVSGDARGSHGNDLLLKIDNEEHRPEALARAETLSGVDLRDGQHWADAAQAEENAGHTAAAAKDWRKAVFYYPDDAEIVAEAKAYATKYQDDALEREVENGLGLGRD